MTKTETNFRGSERQLASAIEFATARHLAIQKKFRSHFGSVRLNTISFVAAMPRVNQKRDAGKDDYQRRQDRLRKVMGLVNNNLLLRVLKAVRETPEILDEVRNRYTLSRGEEELVSWRRPASFFSQRELEPTRQKLSRN